MAPLSIPFQALQEGNHYRINRTFSFTCRIKDGMETVSSTTRVHQLRL